MSGLTQLSTSRLLLKRLEGADREVIRRMDSDASIVGVDGLRSADESDAFVEQQLAHWNEHGFGTWIAFDRVTRECVGRGGLRFIVLDDKKLVQLGYGLFPRFWGCGLATELAIAATSAGFERLALSRIVAVAKPTNVASRRVLGKVGFQHVRDIFYEDATHAFYERLAVS